MPPSSPDQSLCPDMNRHPSPALRVCRALSWLSRAEQVEEVERRFIFYRLPLMRPLTRTLMSSIGCPGRSRLRFFAQAMQVGHQVPERESGVVAEFASSIRALLDNALGIQDLLAKVCLAVTRYRIETIFSPLVP